jgi:hypothetical protein
MKNANNLLENFSGTEHYYKHVISKLNYSDGVKEACSLFQCYWFLDLVFSYQTADNRINNFQVWTLKRVENDEFLAICTDGNENILIKQEIPISDFLHDSLTFFFTDSVCLLPSEY